MMQQVSNHPQQQQQQAAAADDPLSALLAAFPCGRLLLRERLAASGLFLIPWLAAGSLLQGHAVVLIAAAHSPAKHGAALRKLGAAAASAGSSGDVAFVAPRAATAAAAGCGGSHCQMQQVYQDVEVAARQLLGQRAQQQQQLAPPALTVLLDSLSCLSCLAGERQVQALLHQLGALGELLQVPYRFVLLAADDVAADARLVAATAAGCHVTLDVAPLEGRTAAVDGSMLLSVRRALQPQAAQSLLAAPLSVPSWLAAGAASVWFFRAGDTGVRWLPELDGKEVMA